MKTRQDKAKRLVASSVALGVLLLGGVVFWRKGLSESSLLEAGRTGPERFLSESGLKTPPSDELSPVSRRTNDAGDVVLRYELVVDRKDLKERQDRTPNREDVDGKVSVPLDVTLDLVPEQGPLAFNRKSWSYAGAKIARDSDTAEEMWARVKTEPKNVRFDNMQLGGDRFDASYHVIQLAASLQLGRYDDAAAVVNNSWIWSEKTDWTARWAIRMQDQMEAFQDALNNGQVDPAMEGEARSAIYHFEHNPRLAAFRREFGELVAYAP